MADTSKRTEVPDILQPENLPPEFSELNPDAREQLASGATTDLGNGPGQVGTPQEPRARQSQTGNPQVNSLAWMSGIDPLPAEDGVPAELRDTPESALDSMEPIFGDEPMKAHRQSGVSPGNAEAEDEDWDHPPAG